MIRSLKKGSYFFSKPVLEPSFAINLKQGHNICPGLQELNVKKCLLFKMCVRLDKNLISINNFFTD